ncbi:hypothetical protein KC323_g127 [Hortaea werneckii]|nr:hypothetical protein KC323_g127 [Hortaea werneckii]
MLPAVVCKRARVRKVSGKRPKSGGSAAVFLFAGPAFGFFAMGALLFSSESVSVSSFEAVVNPAAGTLIISIIVLVRICDGFLKVTLPTRLRPTMRSTSPMSKPSSPIEVATRVLNLPALKSWMTAFCLF